MPLTNICIQEIHQIKFLSENGISKPSSSTVADEVNLSAKSGWRRAKQEEILRRNISPQFIAVENEVSLKEIKQWIELLQEGSFLSQQEYVKAIEVLQRALQLPEGALQLPFPRDTRDVIHVFLAHAYLHLGEIRGLAQNLAKVSFDKDFSIKQAISWLLFDEQKGLDLLQSEGEHDDRVSALLQKVLQKTPTFKEIEIDYITRTQFSFRQGDYDAVIQNASRGDYEDEIYLAAALGLTGKFEEAMAQYSALIEKYPDYEDVYIERGLVYLLMGNRESALADFLSAETIRLPLCFFRNYPLFMPKFIPNSTLLIEWIEPASPERKKMILDGVEKGAQEAKAEDPFSAEKAERKYYKELMCECNEILKCETIDTHRYMALLNRVKEPSSKYSWLNLSDYKAIASCSLGNFDPTEADLSELSGLTSVYIETKKGTHLPDEYKEFIKVFPEIEKELHCNTSDDCLSISLICNAAGYRQKAIEYRELAEEARKEFSPDLDLDRDYIEFDETSLSLMLRSAAQRIVMESF